MKMLCIANCQYRGVTRNGSVIEIEGADLELPIVKHNFIPAKSPAKEPPVLKFGNGNPLKKEGEAIPPVATGEIKPEADQSADPAGLTNGVPKPEVKPDLPPADEPPPPPPPPVDFTAMTVDQLKKHLDSVGAKYTTRSTKDELVNLAIAAQELIKE